MSLQDTPYRVTATEFRDNKPLRLIDLEWKFKRDARECFDQLRLSRDDYREIRLWEREEWRVIASHSTV